MIKRLSIWLLSCGILTSLALGKPADESILSYWHKFNSFTSRGIHDFQRTHLAPLVNQDDTILYPFGGPDITYPLILFPGNTNYILIGLEPCQPNRRIDLSNLETDNPLISLYRRSFFGNAETLRFVAKTCSVLPTIEAQLNLLQATDIVIDEIPAPTPGIEINFTLHGAHKNIKYFQGNLDDRSDTLERLSTHLESIAHHQITLFKSTSYLPHLEHFSKLRDLVMDNSRLIIQDDSGIPLQYLANHFTNIQLYGQYNTPYGLEFQSFLQPDLQALYNNPLLPTPITFCFGYGCGRVPANLVIYSNKSPSS